LIRRAAILLGVPGLFAVLVAVPLGWWRGDYQWLCAGVAVALVVPPGLVTLVMADRLSRTSIFGPLLALAVGTAVRLVVGFGGAVFVFLASKPTFHADPISFFGWVLGIYLTTLVTETALLAGMKPPGGSDLPNV
jgi:hypothetical protein